MSTEFFNVADIFGENVFNDTVMQARLPKKVYKNLKKTIEEGKELDLETADVIAHEMKEWAIEKGATHYTHWFLPLTGVTAEKHDSFISAPLPSGKILMSFSGKELIKGEPDASSFPSGGLRATFEARGYTAWDCTSPAFVRQDAAGGTLCIPTAFCSYTGEALDQKTPLLRSMEAINVQALRLLRLFGNTTSRKVTPSVGPEQEYFLVDAEKFQQRKDLIYTGRTLFGAMPPKGQELDDHYFGTIRQRIAGFMRDVNTELWKVGVSAKTQHNEVAPAQHELAPIYAEANIAVDHNQIVMQTLKRVACQHGMKCLLHEKPFAGVNGSGKHNNWSLSTDAGVNLLSPGETPYENAQFLLFLCAVIRAVDDFQDLLRISVATAGNDHRLGANEAPPAVVSMFLGEELTAILDAIEHDASYTGVKAGKVKLGADVLPRFRRDTTDRNRTSPFAFTGNKFEFRMVGSSDSIACANIMLNAAMAESLKRFADQLEGTGDFESALQGLIRDTIRDHKRIIFNGNGYDAAWIETAVGQRGLMNYPSTPDCVPHLLDQKNVDMLTSHGVYTKAELVSRCEVTLDNYCKTIFIEARTMADMARTEILPAIQAFAADTARAAAGKKALSPSCACAYEMALVEKLSGLTDQIDTGTAELERLVEELAGAGDIRTESERIRDRVLPQMERLRRACDEAETVTAKKYWPFPNYGDLLFSVR